MGRPGCKPFRPCCSKPGRQQEFLKQLAGLLLIAAGIGILLAILFCNLFIQWILAVALIALGLFLLKGRRRC